VTWNGEAHQLARSDDGRGDAQGALAVLHMVVERWLGVFEYVLSLFFPFLLIPFFFVCSFHP